MADHIIYVIKLIFVVMLSNSLVCIWFSYNGKLIQDMKIKCSIPSAAFLRTFHSSWDFYRLFAFLFFFFLCVCVVGGGGEGEGAQVCVCGGVVVGSYCIKHILHSWRNYRELLPGQWSTDYRVSYILLHLENWPIRKFLCYARTSMIKVYILPKSPHELRSNFQIMRRVWN